MKCSPWIRLPLLLLFVDISLACGAPLPAAEPAKLATEARLDLLAGPEVGEINDGRITAAGGRVERMHWRPENEQPLGYSIHLGVIHYAWRDATVEFTPKNTGKVALILMGRWFKTVSGALSREEVLWDDLRAEGAKLENGSFENVSDGSAVGWHSAGASIDRSTDAVAAPEGVRVARTWHDARLSTQLAVQGGRKVTLRFRVRAARPADFAEMPRNLRRDTAAHQAARRFLRGANFGNCFEAPPGQNWGQTYGDEDFRAAKAEGFDHVRLPIAWQHHAGPAPDYRLSPAIFSKIDPLGKSAAAHKLALIINVHHFDALTTDPEKHRDMFLKIWEQLAAHYKDQPQEVAFELLNEPRDAATTKVMNPIYAEAITRIRRTNPGRTLFVGPGLWNGVRELPFLMLPTDDQNLIVTVHSYDPHYFTHQGASWAGPDTATIGIRFPGPPPTPLEIPQNVKPQVQEWLRRYNTLPTDQNPSSPKVIRETVQLAKEWSEYFGRPIHFGEFGAYISADVESRANYCGAFRTALEERDIPWALWDWKAGFRYWDSEKQAAIPEMRKALFGK